MLKNVLSLLLSKFYSKQESEAVGHQAMPSPSNTVITPSIKTECTTWSDAHIGIAPADGYLYVTGRTTNTDGFLQISSDTTEIAATTFGNTDKDIRLLFPFAKGQAMKVTAKSLKNIFLRFSSSIGGGYQALKNALLQGGVLCRLKHLYSSLRRSSLSVRRHGSATSLKPSYQGARKSPLSLTPILKTTQRRATELYVSILLTLRGQSSALLLIAGGAYFTARTKQEFIKCLRFLSQRVKRSTLISQRIKAPLISSSFRPLVLNEVKGGVSC